MANYIKELRKLIGSNRPILVPSALLVIYKDNEFLLQRRSDDGTWAFHGGSMEIGEAPNQTMLREVKEELGITPTKYFLFNVYGGEQVHHIYPNGDEVYYIPSVYFCTEYNGKIEIDKNEVKELKWFHKNNLPDNLIEVDKVIWKDLLEYVNNLK